MHHRFAAGAPLVVGAPRTGFTLLINILSRLLPFTGYEPDAEEKHIRHFVNAAGDDISKAVLAAFDAAGLARDVVYARNFQFIAGGPRWIDAQDPAHIRFRKYIGIRGHGDLTLITRHDRALLKCQDIMHSHSNPAAWTAEAKACGYRSFASLRNPIGTLYSSCFSINALTSDYIQKFLPPEDDTDQLREVLALYKLTDLQFFSGLITPLMKYLDEFDGAEPEFDHVMRWENLIAFPTETIRRVAYAFDLQIDQNTAESLWGDMAWRNLTGRHKHNYRRGHGIVGGWRRYLVNEHLALMRDAGLERMTRRFGYGAIPDLHPDDYTPYQRRIAGMIKHGDVYRDYQDPWLFEFAFNKSNLDSSAFEFRRYPWREHTQIERSSLKDDTLAILVSDAAEAATAKFNAAFASLLAETPRTKSIPETGGNPPRLLHSLARHNIVVYQGQFYGLPKDIGPIDIAKEDPHARPGVVVRSSYNELLAALGQ